MGMASVSATIASTSRISLVASRRSRRATSSALCRSRLGQLTVVAHDGEIDVLEGRQIAQLPARLQAGAPTQLGNVADRQRSAGRHDPDLARQYFGLFHAVRADHERAALFL